MSIVFLVLLFPLILLLVLYRYQHFFVFQPVKMKIETAFDFNIPHHEFWIRNAGLEINVVLFKNHINANKMLIYLHGNADNIQRWGRYATDFTSHGLDVLMPDYPGFGKSSGAPTEDLLYETARQCWEWAQTQGYPPGNIYIYGRSLGCAPAAYLASKHPDAAALILETPFYKLSDLLAMRFPIPFRWMPTQYLLDVHAFLKLSTMPVSIIIGTKDRIVPPESSRKLKSVLKPVDRFVEIKGGGHKNLRAFTEYHSALKIILSERAQGGSE